MNTKRFDRIEDYERAVDKVRALLFFVACVASLLPTPPDSNPVCLHPPPPPPLPFMSPLQRRP